jgi:hypothetical protein
VFRGIRYFLSLPMVVLASALIFWINFASCEEMEKDFVIVVVKGFVPV